MTRRNIQSLFIVGTGPTITITGLTAPVTTALRYAVLGNFVTIEIDQFSGTKSGAGTLTTSIPLAIAPTFTVATIKTLAVQSGGSFVTGQILIDNTGAIIIYASDSGGTFSDGVAAGTNGTTILSWYRFS
jgi:hypothetical protein